jgi:hypothetical protein
MQEIHSAYPENESLASVHRSWGFPSDDELRWLLCQGVSDAALWPISGATVRFDRSTFDLDESGERALTFRATDCGEAIDLVAWQPTTSKIGLWRSVGFCLGDQDQIFNPATYFGAGCLQVHANPLEWLRSGRQGIMIVTPKLTRAYLGGVSRLMFADVGHKRLVRRWMTMKPPLPEMLLADEGAAA